MNRYYGTLMYCAYLPFAIEAKDEKKALTKLKKAAPALLTDDEKKELSFHLTRIPQADRVLTITKETPNA